VTSEEASTQTARGRARGAWKGVLAGLVLVGGAAPLLFWNEGSAIHRAEVLDGGRDSVVALEDPIVDPANEGKLVLVTGELKSNETLRDPQLGLDVQGVRLERHVEMYQWREHTGTRREKVAGGSERTVTEHSYEQVWTDRAIDSSRFHEPGHSNPPLTLLDEAFDAVNVTVGQFRLSPELVAQVQEFRDLPAMPRVAQVANLGKPVHVAGPAYYVGANPNAPAVGDLRVTFRYAPAGEDITILGQQVGDTFTTWASEGNSLEPRLVMDEEDVDTMFEAVKTESAAPIWALRFGGFLLAFLGFFSMLRPLAARADDVPVLGPLVKGGAATISFAFALGVGLVTISIGWLVYSPLVGVPLVLLAIGVVAATVALKLRRKAPREPAAKDGAAPPPPA
jgi:hypothetical protein